MKFKHADHVSSMQVGIHLSIAKICCMIGCILIAGLGHIDTAFYGLTPGDSHAVDGFSQSNDTRTANLNGNSNPLTAEAFFDSDKKTNPFLLLLAFRELSAGAQKSLYPFCITYAHLSDRFGQKAPNIYYTLVRRSTPLRC